MAQGAISAGIDVATNTRADKVVFGDKSLSKLSEGAQDDSDSSSSSESTPIKPKDFFWDQLVVYLVSAILALGFLNISIEFFRGSQVQCFNPDSSSRQQDAYVNDFCYGSLPDSQYYLIFILISAVVIIAPHYLWDSYFTAHFSFFFDLVKKLSRLRDSRTGNYNRNNFEIVKKLEEKFRGKRIGIYRLYVLKLLVQLTFSLGVLFADAFYFRIDDFHESFFCPANVSELSTTQPVPLWHFDQPMACVYNSLRLLSFIHKASFLLVVAAVVVLVGGLCWTLLRHTTELGAKKIAKFCDQSCLPPEVYTFPSLLKVIMSILTCGRSNKHLRDEHMREQDGSRSDERTSVQGGERSREHTREQGGNRRRETMTFLEALRSGLKPALFPRIQSDLDFLLLRLFRADSGHGHVFKDIQVYKELRQKFSEDHQQLFLLNRVHHDWMDQTIDKLLAAREKRRGQTEDTDAAASPKVDVSSPDKDWTRLQDMHRFFYESGLKKIGRSPEDTVYTFFKSEMGINPGDWTNSPLRSVLYGLLQFSPSNRLAIDVSFGTSSGYSLVLARAFLEVVTIHFNPFYHNLTEICREDVYQTNLKTITLMDDIFSQNTHNICKSEKLITKLFSTREDGGIDLIVIGPITDRTKIVTTNLLIEKLYSPKFFSKGAILMAIRPLMIGSKSRMGHFVQFNPPQGLFDDINAEVEEKLHDACVPLFQVSDKGKVTQIPNPKQISTGQNAVNEDGSPSTNKASQATVRGQGNTLPTANPAEANGTSHSIDQAQDHPSSSAEPPNSATGMVMECNTPPRVDSAEANETSHSAGQGRQDRTSLQADPAKPPNSAKGMVVECSGVECIFEFQLFRYKGSKYAMSKEELDARRQQHHEALKHGNNQHICSNAENDSVSSGPGTPSHSQAVIKPNVPGTPTLDQPSSNGGFPGSGSQTTSHANPELPSSSRHNVIQNVDPDLTPADNRKMPVPLASVDSEISIRDHPFYQRGESQQPLLPQDKN